jgi:hypothetical protein
MLAFAIDQIVLIREASHLMGKFGAAWQDYWKYTGV